MIEFHEAAVSAPTIDGDLTILHPVSLTLAEPKISIIGANGSGKSTLARLINGLVEPTAGRVTITPTTPGTQSPGTKPLDTARDGAAVRRSVGFVFTDPTAQMIMPTVIEDVELSLRRTHRKKPERRAAAEQTLERFGLQALKDRSVHALSGGQRQLLAIASVLATDPAILIADEPTTLLDLTNSRRIGDLLLGLAQQTIIVTHDLELAARADRTLVVEAGRIAFDGEPHAAVAWYRANA
ncbi:energy-coupling factor ABC transporter ATP-binding protein [Leucobacter salsicius]|uniref:energy-coupling factor ABC transporter ATP-binding protein n=1 Tax=Leucobacter salsicius TaxID=664638 RepID=UPI00034CDE7B|nr:ABC transporter ATP-binding protein [Leucobacter salsicius]